ncbi:hypothetical protein BD414DRAFT_501370 [Trametes punicea]|nr:hypothetical protein BD414DRAFT_501370 [Trametes punicea]
MSGDSTYEQEIVADYPRLLMENYCIIASSALLWFDFALTLPTEYRRIWKRKFTGATLVYLFTRYVAVIERIFFVLEVLVWRSSDKRCGGITHTDDMLVFINYLAFAAFTCLRIYAVWGRDWKPLLIVAPLTLVRPISGLIEDTRYTPVQGGPPFGCVYIYHIPDSIISTVSIASRATTIAAEVILIVLTWIKTFGINRDALHAGVRTPLATLLLRDGTAYFLIILAIQVVSIIADHIGSPLTIWLVWPYFDQVLTVIFLSRFMLDLRGLYFADRADRDAETSLHLSDVNFHGVTSNIVGNLGATLTNTLTLPAPSDTSASNSDSSSYTGVRYRCEWDDDDSDLLEYCNDPFAVGLKAKDATETSPRLVTELAGIGDHLEKQQIDSPQGWDAHDIEKAQVREERCQIQEEVRGHTGPF